MALTLLPHIFWGCCSFFQTSDNVTKVWPVTPEHCPSYPTCLIKPHLWWGNCSWLIDTLSKATQLSQRHHSLLLNPDLCRQAIYWFPTSQAFCYSGMTQELILFLLERTEAHKWNFSSLSPLLCSAIIALFSSVSKAKSISSCHQPPFSTDYSHTDSLLKSLVPFLVYWIKITQLQFFFNLPLQLLKFSSLT